jgi:hypothetical protein
VDAVVKAQQGACLDSPEFRDAGFGFSVCIWQPAISQAQFQKRHKSFHREIKRIEPGIFLFGHKSGIFTCASGHCS